MKSFVLPVFLTLAATAVQAETTLAAKPAPVELLMKTSKGPVHIELYPARAPKTVENFLRYVDEKLYDGTIFHRVIKDFVVQGGGFGENMSRKKTHAPIANEADNGLKNDRGTLAMARTGDPHSATSQFYINMKNNDFLNHTGKDQRGWGYCVFGKVTAGMEVVDKIAAVKTAPGDVPAAPVFIESITRAPKPKN